MQYPTHHPATPPASTEEGSSELTPREKRRRRRLNTWWTLITLVAFVSGSVGGYFLGSQKHGDMPPSQADMASLAAQINPPEGYTVPATFGDIGPKLLEAGAMKADDFVQVYASAGQPLSQEQLAILQSSSPAQVVFNRENAYFLLNFFWALGLTNDNPVLTEGPMMRNGRAKVVNYASTGGWTLAAKPVGELYASASIVALTAEQQSRLEEVVRQVYRPCCDNPTHFPDCNHGMAMLGLLELMASQNASLEEMLLAAKYVNAYWYPQQTVEQAVYFLKTEGKSYQDVDAKLILGPQYSSLSGFKQVHQALEQN